MPERARITKTSLQHQVNFISDDHQDADVTNKNYEPCKFQFISYFLFFSGSTFKSFFHSEVISISPNWMSQHSFNSDIIHDNSWQILIIEEFKSDKVRFTWESSVKRGEWHTCCSNIRSYFKPRLLMNELNLRGKQKLSEGTLTTGPKDNWHCD